MNADQFAVWLSAHFAAFPDTQKWISNTDKPNETIAVWSRVLADTDASAAITVTEKMARGDIAAPEAYERERTAAIVRREASKVFFALQTKTQHAYDEPRVNCPTCQDAGSVTVWARRSIKFAKEHGEAPAGRYVEAVACTCERGNGLATEKTEGGFRWTALPRFDSNKFCRVKTARPNKSDIDKLLEFVGRPATQRYSEFDEWNAGHETESR